MVCSTLEAEADEDDPVVADGLSEIETTGVGRVEDELVETAVTFIGVKLPA